MNDVSVVAQSGVPKKLSCGHLFHSYCLQNWLERQFTCPTCRHPIPAEAAHDVPRVVRGQPEPAAAVAADRRPEFVLPIPRRQPVPAAQQRRAELQEPLPQRDEPPTPPMRPNSRNRREQDDFELEPRLNLGEGPRNLRYTHFPLL